MKAVVREAKREVEDRFGTKLSLNFKENWKMFWIEVKRVRKGVQADEMRIKDRDGKCWLKGRQSHINGLSF